LRLLAAHRNPESFVAGATPLAREGPRFSKDIDVFHDRENAMQEAVNADTAVLEQEGLSIEWIRRFPTIFTAIVRNGDGGTLLEWVVDSAYRFFPAIQDELFGYVLHPADIATNKALAAAGRREPRDIIDLLAIHERYLLLGAVVWAACAKDPGFSPEGLIAEIRRNARYQQADYDRLENETPIDAAATSRALRSALDDADAFVRSMPAGKEGLLFLDRSGRPVQPDPARLDGCVAHGGQERGHWPSSPEISRAMLEHYNQ
jgi:Nucleotidyl transferase AbiEii toxin, Type IV TA system